MMHLSDSGSLAEGDFDYKPDSSLQSRKELQDFMSNIDLSNYFERKKNKACLYLWAV